METLQTIKYFLLLSLNWIPRILCILVFIFLSLFSFDVFGQNAGFWKTLIAFLIHNIPTMTLIAILILSWKWAWIGGISFIALGIGYLIWFSDRTDSHFIDITLFTVGLLFLLNWFLRKEIKKAQDAYWENN